MKKLSNLLAIGLLLGSILSFAQPQKPNVVFILADDCTKFDLGCYGSPDSKTPTIDKLAAEGMQFNRCYQAAPMCSPTRHSIYTGLYPVRSGAYPNHTHAYNHVKSVVQYLTPLGYRVGLTGKTHIAPKSVFDFEYLDDKDELIGTRTDAFLKSASKKEQNFCLFVCSNEPHGPWNKGDRSLFDPAKLTLPEMYADLPRTRQDFRNYLAEINYLDGQVQSTLDVLEKYDLRENTVVIFASEQGNSFPFAKWTCYQAGLGSALIVNWPGTVKPGLTSEALVEYTDILPTIIDIAGGKAVENLDGSSLVPILKQEMQTHKQYTYGIHTTRKINNGGEYYPIRSVADDTFRLIWNLTPEMPFKNVVTDRKWFIAWLESPIQSERESANRYLHRPEYELYHDIQDPYNQINLIDSSAYIEKVQELKAELLRWMIHCGDMGIKTELEAEERMKREKTQQAMIVITDMQEGQPKGEIHVEVEGFYSFYTQVDCEIYVDGIKIIEPIQRKDRPQRTGVIGLKPGKHTIETKKGLGGTKLSWSGPGFKKTSLMNRIFLDVGPVKDRLINISYQITRQ